MLLGAQSREGVVRSRSLQVPGLQWRVVHLRCLRVREVRMRRLSRHNQDLIRGRPFGRRGDGLDGYACHAAALFRTALAFIRAALAMVLLVLAALGPAGLADLGADPANVLHEPRVPAHVGRG